LIHPHASIAMIEKFCFCVCRTLAPIRFGFGSHVSRLEFRAFSSSILTSIYHPASVDVNGEEFLYGSHSLHTHPLARNQFTSDLHRQPILMRDVPLPPYWRRLLPSCPIVRLNQGIGKLRFRERFSD
jgi:hypothetical protein